MEKVIQIGNRKVGDGQPTLITAEIGLNHNGDLDLAIEMIRAAAEAGVDAVKFQAFRAHTLVSKSISKAKHQKQTLEQEVSLFDMWKKLEFSREHFQHLQQEATQHSLIFFASAFDTESVEILDTLDCPVFKIASGDLTYLPLIQLIASKKRPIILSVGMGTLSEIADALGVIFSEGNHQVIILQCVANYPAEVSDVNLRKMQKLREVFDVPVGFSDHTTSIWVPVIATALGACVIEKHFTLDKSLPGSDQAMSADPAEMKRIVEGVREAEAAIGSNQITPNISEQEGRTLYRRSLVAACDIPAGTALTEEMIAIKRPATGIAPKNYDLVLGRVARIDIPGDMPITWDAI